MFVNKVLKKYNSEGFLFHHVKINVSLVKKKLVQYISWSDDVACEWTLSAQLMLACTARNNGAIISQHSTSS